MMPSLSKLAVVTAVVVLAIGILVATSPSGVTPPHTPAGSPLGLVPPWPVFNVAVRLNSFFAAAARATTPPDVAALDLATAWFKSEVAYGLVKNGIIDLVAARPGDATCGAVAAALELQAFVVCQYMEAGARLHVLARDAASGAYALTPAGAEFRAGHLRDFLLMINEESREMWRGASTRVMTEGGISGFEAQFGQDWWTWHSARPEKEAQFDRAMMSLAPGPTGALLSDWRPPRDDIVLCDVGGGLGHVLATVLEHYPRMRGLVLDQPETARRANEHLRERGLADRAEAVGGDFFSPFPAPFAACDVYHLRFIVHDWADAENVALLKNVKASAERAPSATRKSVAVMDHVLDTGASPAMEQSKRLMSINMVGANAYGARERTVAEHEELFAAAGFRGARNVKVTPLRAIQTLLEAEI